MVNVLFVFITIHMFIKFVIFILDMTDYLVLKLISTKNGCMNCYSFQLQQIQRMLWSWLLYYTITNLATVCFSFSFIHKSHFTFVKITISHKQLSNIQTVIVLRFTLSILYEGLRAQKFVLSQGKFGWSFLKNLV